MESLGKDQKQLGVPTTNPQQAHFPLIHESFHQTFKGQESETNMLLHQVSELFQPSPHTTPGLVLAEAHQQHCVIQTKDTLLGIRFAAKHPTCQLLEYAAPQTYGKVTSSTS